MNDKKQLVGIQYLRGIAALMVAYLHMVGQIPAYASMLSGTSWFDVSRLSTGADIFFVISGFIMVATSGKLTALEFVRRRLIRIVPLYWMLTLLLAVLVLAAPTLFRTTHLSLFGLLKSLGFIPYTNPDDGGDIRPMLVPGWSLNIEMYFYLIFAITLWKPLRSRQAWIVTAFFVAMVLAHQMGFGGSEFGFYAQGRVLEFCAGMILALPYLSGKLSITALVLLMGCAIPILVSAHLPQNDFAGLLPSAAIVAAVVAIECAGALPMIPWLGRLGDASYSIYLTHIFTLGVMRAVWQHIHIAGHLGATLFAVTSMGAVCVVAVGSYKLIEVPALKLLQGRKPKLVPVAAPAG